MVTIKDGCGCDPCDCDWKQKLKEAYSRAIQSVNKIGDETGRVYFPDGTGFVKVPLPTKEQFDSIAEIDGIKASVDELNVTVPALESQVTGVTRSLVSNVEVLNGTTAGKFKVRIDREKAAPIDSNDYDLSKVNSIELIQGSGPAMVKAQLTLSDGTVLRSDDFLFTTESIGTDVYISSFTFKAGNVDGTISADIGLNNGVIIEANNFLVPTDPNVISSITDLQTRTGALEQNVIDINNKADLNNVNQVIVAKQIDLESIVRIKSQSESAKFGLIGGSPTYPFTITHETEAFGQIVDKPIGSIAMLNTNGVPSNFTTGEVWEEVNLSSWPTDWVVGERLRIDFKTLYADANPYVTTGGHASSIIELTLNYLNTPIDVNKPINIRYISGSKWGFIALESMYCNYFNNNDQVALMFLKAGNTSGNTGAVTITKNNISTYVRKMWRLRP